MPAEALALADLHAVVVNWNTRDRLRECLTSLTEAAAGPAVVITVVDNASSDGSADMVAREFPQVRLIRNPTNAGFAAANNQAMRSGESAAVLLLNPDSVLRSRDLVTLYDRLMADDGVGIVAPKVVRPALPMKSLECGFQPTLRRIIDHFLFLNALLRYRPGREGLFLRAGLHDKEPRDVEWVSGCCMLVRSRAIAVAGLMSERWFMYAEDWEWCDRIRRHGWRIVHDPDVTAVHHVGAASRQNPSTRGLWVRSLRSWFILRENPGRGSLLLFDGAVTVGLVLRGLLHLVRATTRRRTRSLWLAEAQNCLSDATVPLQIFLSRERG